MMEIAIDLLAAVCGAGESSTQVNVGPVHYRSTTSDYRTCVDAMRDATKREYPDTRPWYQFGFGTDHNAQTRAHVEAQRVAQCGPPPTN